MIKFCDGVRHLYVRGLHEIDPNISTSLNQWLSDGSGWYTPQNQLPNDFTIATYSPIDFLGPYAYEINRLSCASLESLKHIEKKTWQPKSVGWSVIKFYYSAFFSAHVILKICGESLTNIEASSLNTVRSVTTNYNYNYENLNTGLYRIHFSHNNNFRFYKDATYDESHQGLWKKFLHLLSQNQTGIYNQLPQSDAQLIVGKMEELKEALKNWNCVNGNWLSRIRNSVNYSQTNGVWFPYKQTEKNIDVIYNDINLHTSTPMTIDIRSYKGKDLVYFVRTCQLINSICMELLNDLDSMHPKSKSFVNAGIYKFKNLYK